MATKPIDVWGGLSEAIGKPLMDDAKSAYWQQRALRTRYPMADTALNFVPYVGVAAGVDGIAQDVYRGEYGAVPADTAGLAVGGASTLAALKGLGAVALHSSKAARGLVGIGSIGLAGFAQAQMREQDAAATKYQGMSIKDIAEQLKTFGTNK